MEQSINFLCDDDKYLELLSKKKDSCSLNFREQFKVCWRFFFCSNSSISYHRFKELVYSNKNPENAEEEYFLSVLNDNFNVEKLTLTSSYPSVLAILSSIFFAQFAQSNPYNIYL